jgi:hypothetical protein
MTRLGASRTDWVRHGGLGTTGQGGAPTDQAMLGRQGETGRGLT